MSAFVARKNPASLPRFVWIAGTIALLGILLLPFLHTNFSVQRPLTPDRLETDGLTLKPFPISVDPDKKQIIEDPRVETYVEEFASNHTPSREQQSFFALINQEIISAPWFQQLANPVSRTLVIRSGERAEEIASRAEKLFRWDATERDTFTSLMEKEVPFLPDGKYYPGNYTLPKDATPEEVTLVIMDRFNAEIRTRYTGDIEDKVSLQEALIIASLIEREAYDFTDMRYISGIIWNRLFIDMKLQLDATLQYARGSKPNEPWWPVPVPDDKYIKSPYNTYLNTGLPPAPIANPSIDAIIAALNPRSTDCLFYFHADDATFHCSVTYEEHVKKLKETFGQGR
jgi:cell division protein YceG involved in septum cleavage